MITRRTIHTPVLVVGAGPAGLVTAIGLARQGVRPLVIERHPSTSIFPRATGVSTRSMEIFRGCGHRRRRPPRRLAGHPARGDRVQRLDDPAPVEGPLGFPDEAACRGQPDVARPSARRTTSSRSSSTTSARSAGRGPASRPSSSSFEQDADGVRADDPRPDGAAPSCDVRAGLPRRGRRAIAAPSGAASASRWRAPTTSAAT